MDDNITTKDVDKLIDKCTCPECGFEDELGIDEVSCDQKKCRQCGAMMMTSLKQQNEELLESLKKEDTIEGKFKVLVDSIDHSEPVKKVVQENEEPVEETPEEGLFNRLDEGDELNKDIDYKSKYHCHKCGIVVSAAVYEDESICPKCGDDFAILEDKTFLDDERRFICPKCNSSYRYTKINEDTCLFDNSLMTVFDKPVIKKSKTPLPTE